MATIGGDRDKLLKQFLENGRRKRKSGKPGRIRTGTPQPGQGEATTFNRSSTTGWVQYSDGYVGPNDAATRARHPLGGTRPFGPQPKKKKRGAAGYNKGNLPG